MHKKYLYFVWLLWITSPGCKKINQEKKNFKPSSNVSMNTGDLALNKPDLLQNLNLRIEKLSELSQTNEKIYKIKIWLTGSTKPIASMVEDLSVRYCVSPENSRECQNKYLTLSSYSQEIKDGVKGIEAVGILPLQYEDIKENEKIQVIVSYCEENCVTTKFSFAKDDPDEIANSSDKNSDQNYIK